MNTRFTKQKLEVSLTLLLFLFLSVSTAMADQVTLAYIDAEGNAQNMSLDANSPAADLALAASLMGENGVGVNYDPTTGSGSLADIAGAMAAAAPAFAARIAQVLSVLSPENKADIVAAVNAVAGVNTKAVLAAVHFGPPGSMEGPQSIGSESAISLELMQTETLPSNN